MSLQLPTILSPPTPCTPVPALTALAAGQVAKLPISLSGSASVLGVAIYFLARQCIRPYRFYHFLNYGLVVRFRLLPTPPLGDAVSFSYGQPVFCPMGTSTPLLVRTLRRTSIGFKPVPRDHCAWPCEIGNDARMAQSRRSIRCTIQAGSLC